jgi:hypothetical protein
MRTTAVLRLGVGGMWLYQGGWAKLLGRDPRHRQVIREASRSRHDLALTRVIGLAEIGLAGWVLSGRRPVAAATVQTAAALGMNAGGILLAPRSIPHPRRLLARNALFLAAVWLVARSEGDR